MKDDVVNYNKGGCKLKSKFGINLKMKNYQFVAQIERDKETGLYIGIIPNLPGAHSQARTLDELNTNLQEVITLCIEEMSEEELSSIPEWIGMQNISVAI